jgi:SAM-dependent methyltransferase
MNPTERFSTRVENYVKYRPAYPSEIIATLQAQYGLSENATIADVGSGTGILARHLLDAGCRVFGVEPNREMRAAGEQFLVCCPLFTSVNATAEHTSLPDSSIDFVTAGQAFHWFERDATRAEFTRILRLGGYVVLIWNERLVDENDFLRGYEQLLREHGTDYGQVGHRDNVSERIVSEFFAPQPYALHSFANAQHFDLESLIGRTLSSSYTPEPGHPSYPALIAGIEQLFAAHVKGGTVEFLYRTQMYVGTL